ncbi:MAG: agmatine deiminase family protein, partial [Chlamydiota bacterium]|nr:agmatine deiminase family protein [Chlamydiota bacterium]
MKTKALKNMILLMLVLVFTLQTLNVFCADTYRHPAEFEKMESLIIVWNFRNWGYEANVEDYHPIFREIVREAQSEVTVYIVSNDGYEISQYLEENQVSLDHIVFLSVRAFPEKAWVRDFGPYFVDHEGDRIILDTGYLDTLDGDQPDPYRSANAFPLSFSGAVRDFIYEPVLLRLDGGNFLTNGDGLILTTENITHSNIQKRPFYSVDELKTLVNEKFGGELHVLKEGPALVSAHIDTATKFINPHTVFVGEGSAEDKRQYPGYQALEENVRQLSQIQYRGRPLNIVRIPLPHVPNSPVTTHPYINSLILNHKVLVPVFNIPEDEQVLAVYRDQMPGYEIIGIDCSRIINTGGAIHCLTKE